MNDARGRAPQASPVTAQGVSTANARPSSSVELAALAFESLQPPCLVFDRQGHVLLANAGAEQFFHVSRARLCRRRVMDLFGAETPLSALLDTYLSTGHPVIEHALRLRRGDGAYVEAAITLAAMDADAHPSGDAPAVLTIHEWTQAQRLRRRLRFRSAARSLNGLSRLLARGVRNPLAAVRGAAQLLEATLPAPDRDLAVLIREEGDRIAALLDRIAAFDQGPLERRPVNLHRVMEQAREACAAEAAARGIRIEETYDPSLPPAWGDRERLAAAVIELMRNAIAAATHVVKLGTAFRHGTALSHGASRTDLPLEISVQDDGPGIDRAVLPHLFAPFASLRPGIEPEDMRDGLGLAHVAQIVDDHAGLIELQTGDDAPGRRGTMVALYLPAFNELTP